MTVPATADRILPALREALAQCEQVRLAVLFGSQARGRARPDSDVDILLALVPDDQAASRAATSAVMDAVGANVHIVFDHEAPPLLRFQIAREGLLLAERTPGTWTSFKARAMVDWWDWSPIAARIEMTAIRRLHAKVLDGRG